MPDPTTRTWRRVALAMFGVSWGANQFAPLLLVYRTHAGLSETAVTAMFGVYALGLIPALLVSGPLSDRHGRRPVLRPVVAASVLASLVLISGTAWPGLLYAGRFLAGVASGVAFSAGSAWVKELSGSAPEGAGARRAAVALSAGFGGGPLIAGVIAQWLPWPTVLPYLVHVALMLVVAPLMWNAADPGAPAGAVGRPIRRLPAAATAPRFLRGVAPWAPWVFGTATIGFATLPGLVAARAGGVPVAFNGAITGMTLFTGILVQPLARRLGDVRSPVLGLLAATGGLGLAALVAVTRSPWLVPLAVLLLGASYGILLVSGLLEVERLADDHELAAMVAIFYALTYVGFAAPYLLAELAPRVGYPGCLLSGAVITAGSVLLVVRALRPAAAAPPADAESVPLRSRS